MKHLALGMVLCLGSANLYAQETLFVYPKAGQTPDKQAADERECSGWALQKSGYDPMQTPSAGNQPQQKRGGTLRGAAAGAAIGAIAGNSDDAAKGAAIGGMLGRMRQSSRNNQTNQDHEQDRQNAEQQQAQRANDYKRAYTGCLEAKDYSVS